MNKQPSILLLYGPNLNRLGTRQTEIYGSLSIADIEREVQNAVESEFSVRSYQSNCEGALIDALQESAALSSGVVMNPGAFAHYSYALRDAVSDARVPVVEVHFSRVRSREEFRHHSVTAPVCSGSVEGFGWHGMTLGALALMQILKRGGQNAI